MKIMAEYIWIDGQRPTAKLRSKTKIINLDGNGYRLSQIPFWGFDGSSTFQAEGHFSDCMLKPVRFICNPIEGRGHILVLCEVLNPDESPHPSNARHVLDNCVGKFREYEPLFGVEQEYTLYSKNDRPYGWPKEGFPHPQGRYYCGVGFDEVHGRPVVVAHMKACLAMGLAMSGINAEVMPAQWEFQLGPLNPVALSDQLWLARWLLYRIGEDHGAYAKLDPKPMSGDWNGAGGHMNFSTTEMRLPGGIFEIEKACERLGLYHKQHIKVYGADNDKRLTGKHETCSINQFRSGVSDRGASIRIPMGTANAKCGYLEDRRPAANMDPYRVCTALIETVCGEGFDPQKYGWTDERYPYM